MSRRCPRPRSSASDALLVILVTELGFAASLHGSSQKSGRELLDALRDSEPGLYPIALAAALGAFGPLELLGEAFVGIVTDFYRPANRVRSLIRVRAAEGLVEPLLQSCSMLGHRVRELAEQTINDGHPLGEHNSAA